MVKRIGLKTNLKDSILKQYFYVYNWIPDCIKICYKTSSLTKLRANHLVTLPVSGDNTLKPLGKDSILKKYFYGNYFYTLHRNTQQNVDREVNDY